jgi:adenylate cyclase
MSATRLLTEERLRLERGYQIGDYTLLERIGHGGEGAVWSGRDNRRGRIVAVKIMATANENSFFGAQVSGDFERQVHLLASLEHPNILPLYEFGSTDDLYYFVMQYSSVGSLADLLMAGPIPWEQGIHVTAQIASALQYLHQRDIVHRDIKPSNILLDSHRRVYLSDFGIAKRLIEETSILHTGRGTGPYAPYEQHIPSLLTPQSDIYSLGIVIFEMLTGRLPWDGTTDLVTHQVQGKQELPDLSETDPRLPASLSAALRKMTAFEWINRPATVSEVMALLGETLPDGAAYRLDGQTGPMPRLDESVREAQDASYLLELLVPGWDAATEPFPAKLAHLALIDAAFTRVGRPELTIDDERLQFMLQGALVYGYRQDYWWQQLSGSPLRLRVCEQLIANEEEEAIERGLTLLSREASDVSLRGVFSPTTLERLISLATSARGWMLRNNALNVLKRAIIPATEWRPVGITPEGDVLLATLACSKSSQANEASRLIGLVHSETAVQAVLDEKQELSAARFATVLYEIQGAAGSLPRLIPFPVRVRALAYRIRQQLLEDSEGLSWSRSLIGLAVGALMSLMMLLGLFASPDAQMRDILLEPYPVSGIVTIVEVNDASLERFGRWDRWSRTIHAELIDLLSAAGAKTIVFDFIFDAETTEAEDTALADAMRRAGNVIQPVLGQGDAYHDPGGTVSYLRSVLPQPEFLTPSAAVGHTNILHDSDGYVRRAPAVATIQGEQRLSLALAAIQLYLGAQSPKTTPEPVDGFLEIAGRRIPVGNLGEMNIHYAGPPAQPGRSTFQTVSYQDVLDQTVSPELLRDKIVLVGMTATAEPDRYLTPVSEGRPMYGVEILANIMEAAWSGRFITRPSEILQMALLLLLGVVTGLLCTRPWSGLLLAAGVATLYFMGVTWLFDFRGIMLDLLFPFFTIALSYATVTAYRFSIEIRRRREIMQLFQARVTPEVAQATIEAVKRGEISLGGRAQEVSLLLADMRGYNEYARLHDPEEVMELINTYRGLVTEGVFAFEGTVAHHEGDQAMAIFNAPLPQPDHAWRAVEASMAIKTRVDEYHQSLPHDHPHRLVNLGYAAVTGRAIVGHTGSAHRYEYTALGHTVMIAAHLARTAVPAQLVVDQETYQSVSEFVSMQPLSPIFVKGEPNPISAYSVEKRL